MQVMAVCLWVLLFVAPALAADPVGRPDGPRPKGVQVWTESVNTRISVLDYAEHREPILPIKIAAVRNGSFCGQLVIGSDQPIKGAKVSVGEIKAVKGPGAIAAPRVAVYYALPSSTFYGLPTWFDALQPEPLPEVAINNKTGSALLPVLLRVSVPKDAAPGDYRGEATVTVAGTQTFRVPIELSVAGWAVPDPKDYRLYVGVYQSPTTLALQYKAPEWSEEHWKLMEKSFALLARAGNKMVNVLAVDQTQFGNDEGMIYWVRKADGSFTYDFTVFDRYMAMAKKQFGTLDYVALHVWHSGGWETRKADQLNTVTVVDEKTGAAKREHMQVPVFGTDESKKFWKPLLDAVRERLAKLDLDKAMCLGILSDGTAPPEVFKAFDEIIPGGAKWMRGLHTQDYSKAPYKLKGGGKVVLHEFCYGFGLAPANKPLPPLWDRRGWPGADYARISAHDQRTTLSWYRETAVCSLFRNTKGIGRVCLDFWPVVQGPKGSKGDIYNRFPNSSCAQREPSLKALTWPGPSGAETTLRYEAFCEGIQYAEAMIALSEAVDRHADALGQPLADECRGVLTDMLQYEHKTDGRAQPLSNPHADFQTMTRRLFDCVAKIAQKLGSPTPAH